MTYTAVYEPTKQIARYTISYITGDVVWFAIIRHGLLFLFLFFYISTILVSMGEKMKKTCFQLMRKR